MTLAQLETERNALLDRIIDLREFIRTETNFLPDYHRMLAVTQLSWMTGYESVLSQRINAYEEEGRL